MFKTCALVALFVFSVGFGWMNVAFAQQRKSAVPVHEAEPEQLSFEQQSNGMVVGSCLQYSEYGIAPSLKTWSVIGPDIKAFVNKLVMVLQEGKGKELEPALRFVNYYSLAIRSHAMRHEMKPFHKKVREAFGPQTKPIEAALAKLLRHQSGKIRSQAATALLCFQPKHSFATKIILQTLQGNEVALQLEVCDYLGLQRQATPKFVASLSRLIRDGNPKARRAAATAVLRIGPSAKAAVPALIDFFQDGHVAIGQLFRHSFVIALPETKNLALAALAEIGPDASAAVPALVNTFHKATPSEQIEIAHCLGKIGPKAKASVPHLRVAMGTDSQEVKIHAACALLNIVKEDKVAVALLRKGLQTNDQKLFTGTLKICSEVGATSNSLVPILWKLLAHKDEDVRVQAALSLGRMGSKAEKAIPALIHMMTKEADHSTHTCLSQEAAGMALVGIGKSSIPHLIKALKEKNIDGKWCTIRTLGQCGRGDTMANAVLLQMLRTDTEPVSQVAAAQALANSGSLTASARPALLTLKDSGNDQIRLIALFALSGIPDIPKE